MTTSKPSKPDRTRTVKGKKVQQRWCSGASRDGHWVNLPDGWPPAKVASGVGGWCRACMSSHAKSKRDEAKA